MTDKTKTFLQRSFSTILLLSLLAGAVSLDTIWAYALLISLLCNLTSIEWYQMQKEKLSKGNRLLSLITGLSYPWLLTLFSLCALRPSSSSESAFLFLMLAALVIFTTLCFVKQVLCMDYRGHTADRALGQLGLMLLSFIYPVWLFCFSFFFLIDPFLIDMLLWIILVTKLADICAYLCGVTLGGRFIKRPFSPAVSPKKSWEGIIGSLILTTVAAVVLANYLLVDQWNSDPRFDLSLQVVIILISLVIFFFSVMGDLTGSLIKRGIEIKDSGSLLPGIGGIFDLIDSPAVTISFLLSCSMIVYSFIA